MQLAVKEALKEVNSQLEEIKKTVLKIFTLSFKKEEKINVAKAIATLKSYQRK